MTASRRRSLRRRRLAAVLCGVAIGLTIVALLESRAPAADVYKSLPFRYIGPPGNRVEAVAGIPGDPTTIYAGAASGGVFKTTDGGLHWDPIFDDQIVSSIGALAVSPSDPNIVWVGTGETFIRGNISVGNGIYKSTDAGKSWTHAGLEKTGRIARVIIDPKDPNVVYVAALGHCYGPQPERGVFRTKDGGKSWERVLFVDEQTGAVDLVMDPSNPRTLFAATWQFSILPWWAESGGPGSGIHVSRDGGSTWTALTGRGLAAPPFGRIGLAVSPNNSKRLYAAIETADQGNLWRSEDSGESWALVSKDGSINRRARYFSRFGVSPDNADEVYFLTQSLTRSIDGGATLKPIEEVYPDQHDIWIDPQNGNRVIVANDRYVNISLNRGRSWFRAGLPIAQIYRVGVDRQIPYNVYGARQDGPTYRGPSNSLVPNGFITDEHWEYAGYSESGWAIPDNGNDEILWVSDNRHVERYHTRAKSTRDANPWPATGQRGGGADTRTERQFRTNWTAAFALSPHDPRTAYAGSQFVHRTTDSGQTWTVISPDLTTNDKTKFGPSPGLGPDNQDAYCVLFAIAESPAVRGVIWAGSNDGLVHVSRDDGKTWTNVTAAIPNLAPTGSISSIEPSRYDGGAAYVTVDRHRANDNSPYIFKTEDYGQTWKAVGTTIPKSIFSYVRVVREDPKRKGLLYAGTENGIFFSTDDGATWMPLQNNLPHAPVSWMVIQPDFNDLVISTFGRGFWILDDLSPIQQLTPEALASSHVLFEPRAGYLFRPGPALVGSNLAADFDTPSSAGRNPPTGASINYYLRAAATTPVALTILDPAGAAIRTLEGTRTPGINRVWWDLYAEAPRGGSRGLPFGPMNRPTPLVPPGVYTVKLSVEGKAYQTKLTLRKDPNADWQ
ncbi:MAG TPA: hypothetical protein VHI99_30910 [Vicinamibacterales bacterium]|nr:hypothetical protein [Vicinamibacterales bacterium]